MAQAAANRPFARITPLAMLQDLALVTVSGIFFWANAVNAAAGQWTSLPFAVEQGLLVGMFLSRRRSVATSRRPLDWLVAAGGWLPLLLRPGEEPGELRTTIALVVQSAGLLLVIVGFSYLGRSFGVVAANRGLKVHGPYRLVRHPIYFAHFVTTSGFLIANPEALNLALAAATALCQLLRIQAEERILAETDHYEAYRARVRWRLLPGIY